MGKARIKLHKNFIKERLPLPEGADIVDIKWNSLTGMVEFTVVSDSLPDNVDDRVPLLNF